MDLSLETSSCHFSFDLSDDLSLFLLISLSSCFFHFLHVALHEYRRSILKETNIGHRIWWLLSARCLRALSPAGVLADQAKRRRRHCSVAARPPQMSKKICVIRLRTRRASSPKSHGTRAMDLREPVEHKVHDPSGRVFTQQALGQLTLAVVFTAPADAETRKRCPCSGLRLTRRLCSSDNTFFSEALVGISTKGAGGARRDWAFPVILASLDFKLGLVFLSKITSP